MSFILKSFAGENFFEYKVHSKPSKAIILLSGFPSKNNYDEIINLLFSWGYNVFYLRYKGSFQSAGKFLEDDPTQELIDFIKHLEKEKTINLWDETETIFKNIEYTILTGSFSGAIALGVKEEKIKKLILCSPVWDFTEFNENRDEQDLVHLTKFVGRAWKNLYRFDFDDIQENMESFENCKWKNYKERIKDKQILVFHDPGDNVVSIKHTEKHIEELPEINLIKHNLGHGLKIDLLKQFKKEIKEFLS